MTEPAEENGYRILHLFEVMLLAMEQRLTAKMDDNSRLASERWVRHDREAEAMVARLAALETTLGLHLDEARTHKLIVDARARPIRSFVGWLWDHWRDLVLLAIGLFALLTTLSELVARS